MTQELNEIIASNPLKRVWGRWKEVARKIGNFQARVILTACYFIVLPPFALVVRWGTDPLAVKPDTPRGWRALSLEGIASTQWAIRQY